MTSEAAALTEQIAELLAEHAPSYQVDGDYGEHQWVECICDSEYFVDTKADDAEHRAHVAEVLAARLADSRPAVTEAAEWLEVVSRLVSTYKHLRMDTPEDQVLLDKSTDLAERALDSLRASLRLSPTGDDSTGENAP